MTASIRILAALASAGLALAAPPALAAAPNGPAGPAIAAYMKGTKIPCYTQAGDATCSIASLDQGVKVFYGQPEAGAETAVAFVTYQYDSTGNGMDQMAIVFRKAGDRWAAVGRADNTIGTSPRNLAFAPDAITYVGTVMGPNDSRVNPTGKGTFRLLVGERGVTFAKGGSRAAGR